ncbi:MAG TPA: hydroxysqualene dehydroxylase HpnE [Nocardioidaceae bacterium]|nr:hydroxysqualene dehydroxylase HpnE [Nocardioidaceae bacterium]
MSRSATVVVGGGLAGIAAAVRLVDLGREVVLVEARPRLGGATYSFTRDGLRVDTGQHVFLRCYVEYRRLLDRMGVARLAPVQPRLEIPVLLPGRRPSLLRRAGRGPAPLHLLPGLLRYGALSPGERLAAARAAVALRAVDPDEAAVDDVRFGDWLRSHGQSARVVRRLWGLVTVAALNIDPDDASLALAARVFRDGLLDSVDAGDIGMPTVSLAELHGEPSRRLLDRLGVRVCTGDRVCALEPVAGGFVVRSRAGEISASSVVLAVPHAVAARLAPASAAPERERWAALGDSPIVNAHFVFDRPVFPHRFAAAPESAVQWLFDKSGVAGIARGQYLVTSVSAADSAVGRPVEQVLAGQRAALAQLLPATRSAEVVTSFVTREPRATFRQAAGTARLRPPARTRVSGLALAGAWTATGWPDTMEGAVRSGLAAADAVAAAARSGGALTGVPA